MRQLLRLYRDGALEPEPVAGLGALPSRVSWAMRATHRLFALRFGLALADGTDEPLMLAASELVAEGIVATKSGANKLLRRFLELGVVWSPGEMPARGKGNGTRLFLPGRRPMGPEPNGGWRVEPVGDVESNVASDWVPGAVFEAGTVPVEAEEVVSGVAFEPAAEAVDESCVGYAVGRGSAGSLDGVLAADGCAAEVVGLVHDGGAYGPVAMAPEYAIADRLLDWARRRVTVGTRNATGFALACQLRDNGVSEDTAGAVVMVFQRDAPAGDHPYTLQEAWASVGQAFMMAPRDPWVRPLAVCESR